MGVSQKLRTSLLLRSHDQDRVAWLNLAARKAGNLVSSYVATGQLNFGHAIIIKGRRGEETLVGN